MADIVFAPDLTDEPAKLVRKRCLALAKDLQACEGDVRQIRETVKRFRDELQPIGRNPTLDDLKALVCLRVISDLVAHGWSLSTLTKGRIKLALDDSGDEMRSKEQVRNRHLLERDEQLREPSVREFVSGM